MKTITIKEFESNFENYLNEVGSNQSFLIKSENGDVLILPYNNHKEEDDDFIRMHTDHEEGS